MDLRADILYVAKVTEPTSQSYKLLRDHYLTREHYKYIGDNLEKGLWKELQNWVGEMELKIKDRRKELRRSMNPRDIYKIEEDPYILKNEPLFQTELTSGAPVAYFLLGVFMDRQGVSFIQKIKRMLDRKKQAQVHKDRQKQLIKEILEFQEKKNKKLNLTLQLIGLIKSLDPLFINAKSEVNFMRNKVQEMREFVETPKDKRTFNELMNEGCAEMIADGSKILTDNYVGLIRDLDQQSRRESSELKLRHQVYHDYFNQYRKMGVVFVGADRKLYRKFYPDEGVKEDAEESQEPAQSPGDAQDEIFRVIQEYRADPEKAKNDLNERFEELGGVTDDKKEGAEAQEAGQTPQEGNFGQGDLEQALGFLDALKQNQTDLSIKLPELKRVEGLDNSAKDHCGFLCAQEEPKETETGGEGSTTLKDRVAKYGVVSEDGTLLECQSLGLKTGKDLVLSTLLKSTENREKLFSSKVNLIGVGAGNLGQADDLLGCVIDLASDLGPLEDVVPAEVIEAPVVEKNEEEVPIVLPHVEEAIEEEPVTLEKLMNAKDKEEFDELVEERGKYEVDVMGIDPDLAANPADFEVEVKIDIEGTKDDAEEEAGGDAGGEEGEKEGEDVGDELVDQGELPTEEGAGEEANEGEGKEGEGQTEEVEVVEVEVREGEAGGDQPAEEGGEAADQGGDDAQEDQPPAEEDAAADNIEVDVKVEIDVEATNEAGDDQRGNANQEEAPADQEAANPKENTEELAQEAEAEVANAE